MKLRLEKFRLPLLMILALVYGLPFYFVLPDIWTWLQFLIGCFLGGLLLVLDEKVFCHWYVDATEVGTHLMTRSLVFIAVYLPLAAFVVTSSGSPLGAGLVLGLGLGLAIEMWLARENLTRFQARFGWQINHQFSQENVRNMARFFTAFLGLLTVLILY